MLVQTLLYNIVIVFPLVIEIPYFKVCLTNEWAIQKTYHKVKAEHNQKDAVTKKQVV